MASRALSSIGLDPAGALDPERPHVVALVGIDGAGKTTLARQLRVRAGERGDVLTVHCPRCHLAPDAPLQGLSQHFEAAAKAADRSGDDRTKMAILYLQMTLCGPV